MQKFNIQCVQRYPRRSWEWGRQWGK